MLPVRSCLIDGEAVVCDENGLTVFDLIRGYRQDAAAVLCAFDLLEVDGEDLRRARIEERKGTLAKLLSHPHEGIAFNQHYTGDGRSSSSTLVRSAVRASNRRTAPAVSTTGSRSRTRPHGGAP